MVKDFVFKVAELLICIVQIHKKQKQSDSVTGHFPIFLF